MFGCGASGSVAETSVQAYVARPTENGPVGAGNSVARMCSNHSAANKSVIPAAATTTTAAIPLIAAGGIQRQLLEIAILRTSSVYVSPFTNPHQRGESKGITAPAANKRRGGFRGA